MTPIEAAIQAATNAGTAHGFAQALNQAAANLEGQAGVLKALSEKETPEERGGIEAVALKYASDLLESLWKGLQVEADKRKAEAAQLEQLANNSAALAYQSIPDMSKVRGAIAVIMGAG
jgi:hypothetical protein